MKKIIFILCCFLLISCNEETEYSALTQSQINEYYSKIIGTWENIEDSTNLLVFLPYNKFEEYKNNEVCYGNWNIYLSGLLIGYNNGNLLYHINKLDKNTLCIELHKTRIIKYIRKQNES